MEKYVDIVRQEYVRGTITYTAHIEQADVDKVNEDLQKLATPQVAITLEDIVAVWENRDWELGETKLTIKSWYGDGTYQTTLREYIFDYLRDWVYEDDNYDQDLESDNWGPNDYVSSSNLND